MLASIVFASSNPSRSTSSLAPRGSGGGWSTCLEPCAQGRHKTRGQLVVPGCCLASPAVAAIQGVNQWWKIFLSLRFCLSSKKKKKKNYSGSP